MAGLGFRGRIAPGESFVYEDNEVLHDLEVAKRPGWDYAVLLNGYRLYPCCRYAYSAVVAALALSSEVDTTRKSRSEHSIRPWRSLGSKPPRV